LSVDRSRKALGDYGEDLVVAHYTALGFEVVARNWRVRAGEIDLIVRRDHVLVICEVKTRTSDRFGTGAEAVTVAKQKRLRRLAAEFLAANESPPVRGGVVRFDVAVVTGRDVEIIDNAF
jgi:putative endonuclease